MKLPIKNEKVRKIIIYCTLITAMFGAGAVIKTIGDYCIHSLVWASDYSVDKVEQRQYNDRNDYKWAQFRIEVMEKKFDCLYKEDVCIVRIINAEELKVYMELKREIKRLDCELHKVCD